MFFRIACTKLGRAPGTLATCTFECRRSRAGPEMLPFRPASRKCRWSPGAGLSSATSAPLLRLVSLGLGPLFHRVYVSPVCIFLLHWCRIQKGGMCLFLCPRSPAQEPAPEEVRGVAQEMLNVLVGVSLRKGYDQTATTAARTGWKPFRASRLEAGPRL